MVIFANSMNDTMQQRLLKTFLEENEKINLSALRTEEACRIGNIQDSLSCISAVKKGLLPPPTNLIDIGTGGGFPLLPLAIEWPNTRCIGLDSTGKKLDAINRIAKTLQLSNVEVLTGRAETLGHDSSYRAQYDIVTSRAVAPLATLLEFCVPFAQTQGHIVLWKSVHIEDELAEATNAMKQLKLSMLDPFPYELEGDFGQRQLLLFRKDAGTPAKYPRPVGIPKKTPIG